MGNAIQHRSRDVTKEQHKNKYFEKQARKDQGMDFCKYGRVGEWQRRTLTKCTGSRHSWGIALDTYQGLHTLGPQPRGEIGCVPWGQIGRQRDDRLG